MDRTGGSALARPRPARRPRVDDLRVSVASDTRLVAEAVTAALIDSGVRARFTPWVTAESAPPADDAPGGPGARSELALLICDLAPARLDDVCARGRASGHRWLVITEAPRGAAWGAVLECGARAVVDAILSVDDLVEVLHDVYSGMSPIGEVERRSLVRQWAELRQQQERIRARMEMLTPREHQVLDLLYEGQTVRVIAGRLGVSESTVRSQVKSVLRKLAVPSQLAAVATVDELHTHVPQPRTDADSST